MPIKRYNLTYDRVIRQLISVGQHIETNKDVPRDLLEKLYPFSAIDMHTLDVEYLSDAELISLIKGTTYVEKELNWSKGYGSFVIFLFFELTTRNICIDKIKDTAEWVIKNAHNHCRPYRPLLLTKYDQNKAIIIKYIMQYDNNGHPCLYNSCTTCGGLRRFVWGLAKIIKEHQLSITEFLSSLSPEVITIPRWKVYIEKMFEMLSLLEKRIVFDVWGKHLLSPSEFSMFALSYFPAHSFRLSIDKPWMDKLADYAIKRNNQFLIDRLLCILGRYETEYPHLVECSETRKKQRAEKLARFNFNKDFLLLNPTERLLSIISNKKPLDWYPSDWNWLDKVNLGELDEATIYSFIANFTYHSHDQLLSFMNKSLAEAKRRLLDFELPERLCKLVLLPYYLLEYYLKEDGALLSREDLIFLVKTIRKKRDADVKQLTSQLYNELSYRNSTKRQKLRECGKDLNATERLRLLCSSRIDSIASFPPEWSEISDDTLKSIPDDLRYTLLNLLRNKPKGAWRKLYVRIKEVVVVIGERH